MFRMEYLFFFVHAPVHWFLAVICFRQHEICFLDSIPKDHKKRFDRLMDILVHLAKTTLVGMEFDATEWKKVEVDVPWQDNAYDCGVFSCMFMLHFVAGIFQNSRPSSSTNSKDVLNQTHEPSGTFHTFFD